MSSVRSSGPNRQFLSLLSLQNSTLKLYKNISRLKNVLDNIIFANNTIFVVNKFLNAYIGLHPELKQQKNCLLEPGTKTDDFCFGKYKVSQPNFLMKTLSAVLFVVNSFLRTIRLHTLWSYSLTEQQEAHFTYICMQISSLFP